MGAEEVQGQNPSDLKRAPVIPKPTGAPSPWGLAAFGMVIGILAGLSTASGTTATLLGLLFASIGGTFLELFNNTRISEENRPLLLIYSGWFSAGMIGGLLLSFGLRFVDQAWMQPYIINNQLSVAATDTAKQDVVKGIKSDVALQSERSNLLRRVADRLSRDSEEKGLEPAAKADIVALKTHLSKIADLLDDKESFKRLQQHTSAATKAYFRLLFPSAPAL